MSYTRHRAPALLAALALVFGFVLTVMPTSPARARASVTEQRDAAGDYLNFWNGGYPVRTYDGPTINNWITIQWLAGGGFELRDNRHGDGSCLGDLGNNPGSAQLSGGLNCPSDGNAGWGTNFHVYAQCGGGYSIYQANHWPGRYVGFTTGNNHPVLANTAGGICLKQAS